MNLRSEMLILDLFTKREKLTKTTHNSTTMFKMFIYMKQTFHYYCYFYTGITGQIYYSCTFSYLPRILLTQPWLTRSCLEMSQGLTPWCASSTILCLTTSGRGLPFTNTPPSWFTPPCPIWDTTTQTQKA